MRKTTDETLGDSFFGKIGRIPRCNELTDSNDSSTIAPLFINAWIARGGNDSLLGSVIARRHRRHRRRFLDTQGVHKVSLQFRKFITKANEKTDKRRLLQNETYMFKFLLPYLTNLMTISHQFLVINV